MKNRLIFVKTMLIGGIALWMFIVTLNNITDPGTKINILSKMFSMEVFKHDPIIGQGLIPRAFNWHGFVISTLITIIAYEIISVFLLWRAFFSYFKVLLTANLEFESKAVKNTNIALCSLLFLWFFFLCGGLFYGYWMGMGSAQTVHLHLVAVTLIASMIVNYECKPANS